MTKNNKIIIVFILTLLIITYNINSVQAGCTAGNSTPASDGGGDGGGGGGGGESCALGRTVICNINDAGTNENLTSSLDAYDQEGNFIGSTAIIKDIYQFLAGRFIGIDAYEEYKKTFYLSINPVCIYGYDVTVCAEESCGCNGETTIVCWTERRCASCAVSVSECRGEANAKLQALANSVDVRPAYIAERQDVNDINDDNGAANIRVEVSDKTIDRGHSEPGDWNSPIVWQTVTIQYTYNLHTAWMDPISGRVKYEQDTENPVTAKDKQTYVKVPEIYTTRMGKTIQVGQYFIPLNAKTTDSFKYYLGPNTARSVISSGLCENLVEKYSSKSGEEEHWSDFLVTARGVRLSSVARTTAEAKRAVAGGCRLSYDGIINIAQQFYGEEEQKTKTLLNGYVFYYRPIDYTEPFPNGLYSTGYWKDLYDEEKNAIKIANAAGRKLDLDDSFNEITYATNSSYDIYTIREYNAKDDNLYTNWQKMSITGTSEFISADYGVSRYSCQTYYALGCGPANKDWEECKKRKTEICK